MWWLADEGGKRGTSCPCCGQHVRVYPRIIYSTVARDMIVAYNKYRRRRFHLPTLQRETGSRSGDFPKTRFVGLIEKPTPEEQEGRGPTGWWRLTSKGVAFVLGIERVPRILIYNNSLVAVDDSVTVNVYVALGIQFDYDALMRGDWGE